MRAKHRKLPSPEESESFAREVEWHISQRRAAEKVRAAFEREIGEVPHVHAISLEVEITPDVIDTWRWSYFWGGDFFGVVRVDADTVHQLNGVVDVRVRIRHARHEETICDARDALDRVRALVRPWTEKIERDEAARERLRAFREAWRAPEPEDLLSLRRRAETLVEAAIGEVARLPSLPDPPDHDDKEGVVAFFEKAEEVDDGARELAEHVEGFVDLVRELLGRVKL